MRFRFSVLMRLLPYVAGLAVLTGLLAALPADRVQTPLFAQGYSNTNPYAYFVPPGNCNTTVSANGTGTQGFKVDGASNTPAVAAQTSSTGTNTHTYICNISPPYAIVTANNGLTIVDAVFMYSPQAALGTQNANLPAGTFNTGQVFSSITYPVAAASQTASTITPVRADSGSLLITPTTSTFNVSTQTAGAYFSVKFTPATPIVWKTDLKQLLLTVILQFPAGEAAITTSPGVLVHYRGQ